MKLTKTFFFAAAASLLSLSAFGATSLCPGMAGGSWSGNLTFNNGKQFGPYPSTLQIKQVSVLYSKSASEPVVYKMSGTLSVLDTTHNKKYVLPLITAESKCYDYPAKDSYPEKISFLRISALNLYMGGQPMHFYGHSFAEYKTVPNTISFALPNYGGGNMVGSLSK